MSVSLAFWRSGSPVRRRLCKSDTLRLSKGMFTSTGPKHAAFPRLVHWQALRSSLRQGPALSPLASALGGAQPGRPSAGTSGGAPSNARPLSSASSPSSSSASFSFASPSFLAGGPLQQGGLAPGAAGRVRSVQAAAAAAGGGAGNISNARPALPRPREGAAGAPACQARAGFRRNVLVSLAGAAALLTALLLPRPAYADRGPGLFGLGAPVATHAREATMESKEAVPSPADLSPEELATVKLFQENTPSVVNVANIAIARGGYYFSTDIMKIPQGQGSGFVWDTQGHIVTNFHVIRGAAEVQVTLLDQSVYKAKIIGGDRSKDIAVLQLQAPPSVLKNLKPVSVGESSNLFVGQKCYAIGNPFGLDHSLSSGIISGLNRELVTGGIGPNLKNMVQTDASINPGNSGGPLLDSRGRLIGINTAIADPSGRGASSGVGFAIPIDTVKGLVDQILTYGRVIRPVLGISIAPQQAVHQLGLEGVLVLGVPPGTPAAKAGMQGTTRDDFGRLVLGDVIVGLNGKPVKSEKDLFDVLDNCKVGETVQVDVLRGGRARKTLSVTLAERAPEFVE